MLLIATLKRNTGTFSAIRTTVLFNLNITIYIKILSFVKGVKALVYIISNGRLALSIGGEGIVI